MTKQKKDYRAQTEAYLKGANLTRVMLKHPPTGVPVLAQVPKDQAKKLERAGKLAAAIA